MLSKDSKNELYNILIKLVAIVIYKREFSTENMYIRREQKLLILKKNILINLFGHREHNGDVRELKGIHS